MNQGTSDMARQFLLVGVFCLLWYTCSCQTVAHAKALKAKLFDTYGYDYKIRPIENQATEIHIYVEFFLLSINSIDEKAETLKTTGYLFLHWKDEFLRWNMSDYGNIEYQFYPQNDVWKPDIALKNSYLDYKQLGDKSLNLKIEFDGTVRWSPYQVFQSTCSIDITYFPFDIQTCHLKFSAWSYTKDEVLMEGEGPGINLEEYESNSAWDIVNKTWFLLEEKDEASIVFVLKIRRKPLYSLLNLVVPVIMLAILNLFTFALPSDGGEKAGYAVTVFLAFAVFLTIMESSFPQNSESVAYFAIYVVMQTIQSTVITLISLVMVRLASFDESTSVPSCFACIIRVVTCQSIKEKIRSWRVKNKVEQKDAEGKQIIRVGRTDTKASNKDTVPSKADTDTEKNFTWKQFTNALDVIFVVLFSMSFIISTIVCLLKAQSN